MREILFRGKRIDNGEWIEGFYSAEEYNPNIRKIENIPRIQIIGKCVSLGVLPETVGQFTGLTDRNGKRIFEGDIIEYLGEKFQVIWNKDEATFSIALGNNEYCYFDDIDSNISAVIGNIYDNPEMQLEKEN